MADGRRRAVFLDRDGTIVADPLPGFLHEPGKVTLLPGVVEHRMAELLAAHGARVDGAYFCPHHPRFSGPCECRKPGLKLFRDAGAALDIDFARSWWVGDRMSDVQPARALGGKGILVSTGEGNLGQGQARANGVMVVADLAAAVNQILHSDSTG